MLTRKRAALAVLTALVGCGIGQIGCGIGRESSDSAAESIINGQVDTAAHDATILLVMMENGQAAATCTGTMVAPNLVLTARHCVSETDRGSLCRVDGTSAADGKIKADLKPKDLLVYTGTSAILGKNDPSEAAAHGTKIIAEEATVLCDRDVAFILLDQKVDAPIAPIRLKEGARKGERLTAVGWGLTEVGKQPRSRMKRANVPVEDVGPLRFSAASSIGLGSSEFSVGEAFCSGDSGGPAFSAKGAVVGVVSRGGNGREDPQNRAAGCIGSDTTGFYTHLAKKQDLVARAFAASGFEPLDEDAPLDAGTRMPDAGRDPMPARDAGLDTGARDASPEPIPVDPGGNIANGEKCKAHLECASRACYEATCRAQCGGDAGTCATGEMCTTKEDIRICIKSIPVPAEPTPKYPPGKSGPTAPVPVEEPEKPLPSNPPPKSASPSKTPITAAPDGGKSLSKAAPVDSSGCSTTPAPGSAPQSIPLAGLVIGALLFARRRRSSR